MPFKYKQTEPGLDETYWYGLRIRANSTENLRLLIEHDYPAVKQEPVIAAALLQIRVAEMAILKQIELLEQKFDGSEEHQG